MDAQHRHTKIIFTIGPATEEEDVIRQLIENKVDVCRINMAHASHEWTLKVIQRIRKICEETDRHIAIMMDVKGPEIRTGAIDGVWELEKGEMFDLYMNPEAPAKSEGVRGVAVNYPNFIHDVKVGDLVLVDNGLIHLKIIEKKESNVRCQVIIPGPISSMRHINLPGIKVSLPALTEKDKGNIQLGIAEGIAYYALSFVREANDLVVLRDYLKSQNANQARIIAKIEDQSGIRNLEPIIQESDGLMVARGDLGIECPYEDLPIIQRRAVEMCINNGKPVIIATHMLESMVHSPVPTRAEITDVANAAFERADCVMLSAESTVGKYPLQCVDIMKKICLQVETNLPHSYNSQFQLHSPKNKMLRSAVVLAQEMDNAGIVVFTRTGDSAQKISSLRAVRCPLYVFTDSLLLSKQLRLIWGVEPFYMNFDEGNRNTTIENAFARLKEKGSIHDGDYMIVLTNIMVHGQSVDTIQLRKVT